MNENRNKKGTTEMRKLCGIILATLTMAAMPLLAADFYYTPQGSAPYYWSNVDAWGGTPPGTEDIAILNDAALATSPVVVKTESSVTVSNVTLGSASGTSGYNLLLVEQGATLSAPGDDGLIIGGATGVVTNYGSVTGRIRMGPHPNKGTFARFDNFGTISAIGLWLGRGGMPSLFYNHAGATFTHIGTGSWNFYMSQHGGESVFINEGTMSITSGSPLWMCLGGGNFKSELRIQGDGTFAANGEVRMGYNGGGTAYIYVTDNGKITGSGDLNIGHSTTGTLVLSNNASIVKSSGAVKLGCNNSYGKGFLQMHDDSSASFGGNAYVGNTSDASGTITMDGNSHLTIGGELRLGENARSVGTVTLTNSAIIDARAFTPLGVGTAARGIMTLAGDSRMYVTNGSSMIVGYANGATGVLNVAENAQLHAPLFKIGQTSVAGTTGFVTLSDNATLFSTNITMPAWGNAGRGTLTVADNSVVTNIYQLQVGLDTAGASGTLAMRGGSICFDIDPKAPDYLERGYHDPLYLNPYRFGVRGIVRGYGKIAFSDPRKYVTEAFNTNGVASPSGVCHYGQIIADGEGVMRDLDFSRFGSLHYATTDANPSGTNGWFAVNKGRLKLPRCLPNRSGYKCVGDCFNYDVDLGGGNRRLANIFSYEFTGATLNHFVFSELYATDRDDIPAGLGGLGADKIIAVWRIGYFSDGPEVDDPTHPSSFTSAKLKFKYSPDGLDGLNFVHVYRHDGTANGKWTRCGKLIAPSTTMPVVSSCAFAPSSENWNIGWFAIVGRVERPSATLMIFR